MRTTLGAFGRALGTVGVVGASLALGGVAAAGAAPPGEEPPARQTWLRLTVAPVDGTPEAATLRCEPPGGTHPDAAAACRDLAAAGGDFEMLPGDPDIPACIDVWDPVAVSAAGRWRGERVEYRAVFGNACELRVATGPVFGI